MGEHELDQLRAERDLYRALLDLGTHEDPEPFVDDALGLITDVTRALRGYLALDRLDRTTRVPAVAMARGFTDEQLTAVRAEISSGIIAEALRTGRTVATASALDDPRFRSLASVQAQRIQAVLCAPIGGSKPIGVLYLQGRESPGPFSESDRLLAETFALRIAPLAERLLAHRPPAASADPTAEWRTRVRAERLVGRSVAMAEMLKQIAVAAAVDVTVLVQGESGTGKTEVARALHESSRRASGPFVEINCGALPEGLLEAELFGAEKGAHSTATRRIPGKISTAEFGTLFLDEIAEIPIGAQAKLLQFLQSRTFFRLGDDAPSKADVRVIVATNVDLEQAVRERRFREDLFYRINVLSIRAPALRERRDDIALLADHLANVASAAFPHPLTLTWAARNALTQSEWPGNVRQLSAAIQRGAAFALQEGADAIDARHLFPNVPDAPTTGATYQDALRAFQKRLFRESLDACDGNVTEAARRLGMARSHMYEMLRALGLGRTRS